MFVRCSGHLDHHHRLHCLAGRAVGRGGCRASASRICGAGRMMMVVVTTDLAAGSSVNCALKILRQVLSRVLHACRIIRAGGSDQGLEVDEE
jgi:hypothetical protein